jgi:hypothetical protein
LERVESFNFLGVDITKELHGQHTHTVVKRTQQCLYPLRRLGPQSLKKLYSCTIEILLIGCITAWYSNCKAPDRKALQRVVRMAQYITGAEHPAIQDLNIRQCQRKSPKLSKTPATQAINYYLCYRMANGTSASLEPTRS